MTMNFEQLGKWNASDLETAGFKKLGVTVGDLLDMEDKTQVSSLSSGDGVYVFVSEDRDGLSISENSHIDFFSEYEGDNGEYAKSKRSKEVLDGIHASVKSPVVGCGRSHRMYHRLVEQLGTKGHIGERDLFRLDQYRDLVVYVLPIKKGDVKAIQKALLEQHVTDFGGLPFANRVI